MELCKHYNTCHKTLYQENRNGWLFKYCTDCHSYLDDKNKICDEQMILQMLQYDSEISEEQKINILNAFKEDSLKIF